MQAAVDRVIRSFLMKHPVSLSLGLPSRPMSEAQSATARADATELAGHLLENYKSQLSRRNGPRLD